MAFIKETKININSHTNSQLWVYYLPTLISIFYIFVEYRIRFSRNQIYLIQLSAFTIFAS